MNNEERAMSVFWLDSGMYTPKSVALRFRTSVPDLEAEVAAFKATPLYQEQYASYVRQQIKPCLSDYPFPEWESNCTLRILKNGRIECIVLESMTNRFYHVYLPDKSYLDNVCEYSRWINRETFDREVMSQQIGNWSALPASDQVSFLIKRFDCDCFVPFCTRIGKDEFVQLTSQRFPLDADWSMNAGPRSAQVNKVAQSAYTPVSGTSKRRLNSNLGPVRMAERNHEISKLTNILAEKQLEIIVDGTTKTIELGDAEFNRAYNLVDTGDSDRLATLALNDPLDIECEFLVFIDAFYTAYGLKDLLLQGGKQGDFSALHEKARSEADKLSSTQPVATQVTPLQVKTDIGPVDADEYSWNLLRRILDDNDMDPYLAEFIALLDKSSNVKGIRNMYRTEFAPKLNENINFRIEQLFNEYLVDSKDAGSTSLVKRDAEDKKGDRTGKVAEPTVKDTMLLLKKERKELLGLMAVQGFTDSLVSRFKLTEQTILRMKEKDRPDFYPEEDTTLYSLYFKSLVPTEMYVTNLVLKRLTPDEIDWLYKNIDL